jgi:hypothetical protein
MVSRGEFSERINAWEALAFGQLHLRILGRPAAGQIQMDVFACRVLSN